MVVDEVAHAIHHPSSPAVAFAEVEVQPDGGRASPLEPNEVASAYCN